LPRLRLRKLRWMSLHRITCAHPRSRIREVTRPQISRRSLLLSSAAALSCSPPKATGFRGYCFVGNQISRSVAVVDLTRFRVRKQIPLDAAPSAVLPHPTVTRVFVLASDAGTVYEIDGITMTVSRRVRAGSQAVAMAMSPRNDALWVLYRDPASLVELPIDTFRPGRRIRLASPPDAFHLTSEDAGERRAAIASVQDRSITLASLTTGAIERTIAAGAEPSFVLFRKDGRQVLAGSRPERSLNIFDAASGKTVVRLPLPVEPRNFCVSSDGGELFISGPGMDAVVIVFPYSTEIWQTVLAGRAPGAMALTELPSYLLVANPETNSLTVLDDSQKLVAVVQVGEQPTQMIVTPDRQYVLVLNEKSGDMAVIRTYSLRAPRLGTMGARFRSAPVFTMIGVGEKPVSAAVVPWV
jgi:DNA-binding beta-propeller fold protein YncE